MTTFADTLISRAYKDLDQAASAEDKKDIYVRSHLAAMRACGAIISARVTPEQASRIPRPETIWDYLPKVAPELADYAQFFAAGTIKRRRAESGMRDAVTREEAEEMLSKAHVFTALAGEMHKSHV